MRSALLSAVQWLAWGWPAAHGQTVYIDATYQNTALADGSGDPWASEITTSTDSLWRYRAGFGNDVDGELVSGANTIVEGQSDTLPQLVTTVDGLSPGAWYRVDVVYWSKSSSENWNVTVGFAPESQMIYSFDGAVILGRTTIQGEQTGRVQDNIYEMTGLVGYIQADGSGQLKVYVDDLVDQVSQLLRTWYDGLLVTYNAAPPPEAPTDLTASGAASSINLSWTQPASPGISTNRVYRSTLGSDGPYSLLANLSATNAYTDVAVADGQVYYYVVTAVSNGGESPDSSFASAIPLILPAAPTDLLAVGTNSVATLAWVQPAAAGIVSNRIYRSTSGAGGPYSLLAGVPAANAYVDASVDTGLIYHYVVTALNAQGESVASEPAFTTPTAPGAVPAIIGALPSAGSTLGMLTELTVTFSGSVFGVDAADLLINGAAAASVSGPAGSNEYTFRFEPPPPGTTAITWAGNHDIFEPGGTPFDAAAPDSSWSYTLLDTVAPYVVDTTPLPGATVASLMQATVTFSEPVTGVSAADLRINGTPAASVSGSGAGPYTFQFVQPAAGYVSFSWAAGHGITDVSSESNAFSGEEWGYLLDPTFGQTVLINEFLTGNDGGLRDEDLESPDWIEIRNSGPAAVDLAGWHLTDDPALPEKWTFPSRTLSAGGYLVVFASGKNRTDAGELHTNFQLGKEGYLALIRPDGSVAHAYGPEYPDQRANVSFGVNSTGDWRYFSPATPGAANGTGFTGLVADTKFSADRGFYEAPFTVGISCSTPGASIYWTTNGTIPTLVNGTLYTGPVTVSGTTLLRAAAFRSGYVSSIPDAQTYIFLEEVLAQPAAPAGYPLVWQASYPADYEMDPDVVNDAHYGATLADDLRSIPTLSIVSDHDTFWNPSTGIYVDANRRTEYAASAELFNGDGTSEFQINCGVQMQGAASRDNNRLAKHSMRLVFKGDYGPAKLDYDWFNGPVKEFNTITLRACFTDSWATRTVEPRYRPHDSLYLRDVWMKESMLAMGNPAGHGNFVHLYINGLYWGLYNSTERLDASFFSDYLGGYEKDWDVMRDFNELLSGSRSGWDSLMSLVNAGITSEADYQAVTELVDIDNLIDYFILHILGEAEDWPSHNWYAAHRRANPVTGLPSTKWIFLPWDQEIVLDPENARDKTTVSNDGTPARIYSQLRGWPEFQVRFGDRVQKHLFNGGALTPSNNIARWQELAARIDRAVVGESARWGDAREFTIGVNPGHGQTFTRDEWWVPSLQALLTSHLPDVINPLTISRLQARGLYPSVAPPVFSQFGGAVPAGFGLVISHPNVTGTIYYTLDGSDPRVYGSGAVAPAAQAYAGPIIMNAPTLVRARVLQSAGTWSALVEAAFYPPQDLNMLALTEIMYNPPDMGATDGSDLEFLELKNIGTTNLNLSGLTFSSGIHFTFPAGTLLGPGQFFVLVRDADAFSAKYPEVEVGGTYTGQLDNGGEKITLSHALGTPVFSVRYNNRAPWPIAPDLADFSLVPRYPGTSQAPDMGINWRASAQPGGSPGADDPDPDIAPVVINEVLAHTDLPEKDAVELYNPTAANVNVGGWFLTDDPSFPNKFRIPNDTFIPAGGWIWFDEEDFNPTPGVGSSFSFSSVGDDVFLFSAATNGSLTGYNDAVAFGASFNGVSFGRYMNSIGELFYPGQLALSLGETNAGPRVGPAVISEINYHPDEGGDEYIELLNITGSPVPLFNPAHPALAWRIAGLDYTFPTNVVLDANGALLVVAIDPGEFRAKYGIPDSIPVLGPYLGQLQNDGENLELQVPDNPNVDGVPYVAIDAVRYDDQYPWPAEADGAGLSLQRMDTAAFGNDPANWRALPPTPGNLPVILSQPLSRSAFPGETVTFRVSAIGAAPLGYQWFSNSVPLIGQSASNLVTAVTQPEPEAVYRVLVTNAVGSVLSDDAMLTVVSLPSGSMERLEDDILLLTYPVLPNRLYQVEYRTNLLDGEWLPYGSPEYVTTDLYEVINSATNEPHAYFRLQALP